ncbi:SARP family transcriptional regulator [Micromonospora sp. Llam7]|uniref:AfsR/SARP family transcriptional regulator n=1 Tax=Micromonospora tarapacensis TaxID=2835305 RepID=UPI001C8304BA|nr:BTAD domain-containing putative transcriptional regulator [Micromonospora tarapacensis]MBX7269730.1 SARP family transcriptional regulator [Micromonospora tarapacensis]
MDFYFLGPLMAKEGPSGVNIPGTRDRKILAALLLNSNRPVHIDLLIDVVWDDDPPATARQQVQNRLGSLRSRLGTGTHQINRVGSHYVLQVTDDQVDGLTFRNLCSEADLTASINNRETAIKLLRDGLELWRGSPIEDIDSVKLQVEAIRWKEYHLKAIETLIELEFSLNRHRLLTADLHGWIASYPYHEGLHCRLAEAMDAGSRTAEALGVLSGLRDRLARELGISTSPLVEELYHRILRGTGAAVVAIR